MSNTNRTNNPFRPSETLLPNIPQTVGNTYGERMKYQKINQVSPTTSSASLANTSIDQFKKKNCIDPTQFAANDTYKQVRRSHAGAPYKPAILNSFENGQIPQGKKTAIPSDEAILSFLDKVISTANK